MAIVAGMQSSGIGARKGWPAWGDEEEGCGGASARGAASCAEMALRRASRSGSMAGGAAAVAVEMGAGAGAPVVDHIERTPGEEAKVVGAAGSICPGGYGGGRYGGGGGTTGVGAGGEVELEVGGVPEKAVVGKRPVLPDPPRMPRQKAWKKRSHAAPVKRSASANDP